MIESGAPFVFAVEDRCLQVTWGHLPAGGLSVEVGDSVIELPDSAPSYLRRSGRRPRRIGNGPVGPGAVTIERLEPATTYDVILRGPGRRRQSLGRVTTMEPPPGALTARFATISDTHFGERSFGALGRIIDATNVAGDVDPYPERCARAAIVEAKAWGGQLVVAKGDLTSSSLPDEFHSVGCMIEQSPLPMRVVLGNHDVRRGVDGPSILAGHGVEASIQATALDLPGLRLILAHTPTPTSRSGRLGEQEIERIVALAADAPARSGAGRAGPVVVAMHHAPQRGMLPTHYPPGLHGTESRRFVARLAEANPACLVIAGHTHRNRRYRVGGVTVAEVGSTKDYPGQWAGYAVHEGGIRQVVRRIASPSAIAWTETTRHALFGLWGRWSPSTLEQRCWVQNW